MSGLGNSARATRRGEICEIRDHSANLATGELLVQYQLLKLGIDSARLTIESGL